MRFVLASQSPARLSTLRAAGIEPTVIVSEVDEDAILDRRRAAGTLDPAPTVLELARAKAEAVAQLLFDDSRRLEGLPAAVMGCDSMLEIDHEIVGKPHHPDVAIQRWKKMRGTSGILHTGHWMIRLSESGQVVGATGLTNSATVHFADITDEEITAYVGTGEPLHVAGAFTVDGLAGPFIERIEGDFHTIVGLSLPAARTMAIELGLTWHEFWNRSNS